MTKHTPEPWTLFELDPSSVGEHRWSAGMHSPRVYLTCDRQAAEELINSRNACAGINPEAVPQLLEAAKDLLGPRDIFGNTCDWCGRVYSSKTEDSLCESDDCPGFKARAAIALAEGKEAL